MNIEAKEMRKILLLLLLLLYILTAVSRDSAVGIATGYGLDD
jgi:hypothetical protein